MMRKSKVGSARNRVTCSIVSWLDACKIPNSKEGQNISVQKRDGNKLEVIINGLLETPDQQIQDIKSDDSKPNPDQIWVKYHEIANYNRGIALKAFHQITEAAGYGKPVPISRGQDLEKQPNYKAEFDLVAMRHKEFRSAPNPDPKTFKEYELVLQNACKWFYARNRRVCLLHGMDLEDLYQYAMIWTCNYLHKFKIFDLRQKDGSDNKKMLMVHLKQRFSRLLNLMHKRGVNCFSDIDSSHIAMFGHAPDVKPKQSKQNGTVYVTMFVEQHPYDNESGGEDPNYVKRHNMLNLTSDQTRRASATKLLEKLLSELPPEKAVDSLKEVLESTTAQQDTKRAAQKYLEEYQRKVRTNNETLS